MEARCKSDGMGGWSINVEDGEEEVIDSTGGIDGIVSRGVGWSKMT